MGFLNRIFKMWSDERLVQGEKSTGAKGREGSFHVKQHLKQICLFNEETPRHGPIPHSQNGTMAKDAWSVRKVYWRRERAHDKTGESVVCVMCCAVTFIRFVDNEKSE